MPPPTVRAHLQRLSGRQVLYLVLQHVLRRLAGQATVRVLEHFHIFGHHVAHVNKVIRLECNGLSWRHTVRENPRASSH